MKTFVASIVLMGLGASAVAGEVSLKSVAELLVSGSRELRLESRAVFWFDPDTATLTSSGIWTGQIVLGPSQLTRYGHKFEDLSASADGQLAARSYECVEGTLGAAMLDRNMCGHYQFGPNGLDDGGLADDVPQGPALSLSSYRVGALTWDDKDLVIVLNTDMADAADGAPQQGLKLTFTSPLAPDQATLR